MDDGDETGEGRDGRRYQERDKEFCTEKCCTEAQRGNEVAPEDSRGGEENCGQVCSRFQENYIEDPAKAGNEGCDPAVRFHEVGWAGEVHRFHLA